MPEPEQGEAPGGGLRDLRSLSIAEKTALAVVVGLAILGVLGHLLWELPIDKAAQVIGDLGSFLVAVFVGAGALWWWRHRDQARPVLNLSHETQLLAEDKDGWLLQIAATGENAGSVPITIDEWRLALVQIEPCAPEILSRLRDHPICWDHEVEWPPLYRRTLQYELQEVARLRPGEHEDLIAVVRVPKDSEKVRVYSFIPNEDLRLRPDEDRGWSCYSLIDLRSALRERS